MNMKARDSLQYCSIESVTEADNNYSTSTFPEIRFKRRIKKLYNFFLFMFRKERIKKELNTKNQIILKEDQVHRKKRKKRPRTRRNTLKIGVAISPS